MSAVITDRVTGSLQIEDAEALVARLQEKIDAAKRRDAEIIPGGIYLDQDGTAYLAVDNVPAAPGEVRLWRLDRAGATHATPDYWWRTEGKAFRRVTTGSVGRLALMADGTEVPR